MSLIFTIDALLQALLIFGLRIVGMSLDTVRVLFVIRGEKGYAWILGFLQASVYIFVITSVLSNLDNLLNIVGYAAGFATGNVVGMFLDEKMAIGHMYLRIISPNLGSAIANRLREMGYAVTELPARGRDGMVTILISSVLRKQVKEVEKIVLGVDDNAFITAEEVRPLRRGFWRA
ncbi:MAG: DUF2179 domain-containing protein [Anaerolineales bacterium]|nr:DUF2179 domain-containing protein [Anaerolineales bacterium]HEY61254.1 DUF2179 domain-containing protein [Anaerolineae bacterium]